MAGKIEEKYAKNSIEQARECLRDGHYTKALSLLGRAERLRPDFQGLNELLAIAEVCLAATWKCSCRLQVPKPKTPDWYRILKVDETADVVTIKKRYRQLALMLHPDKNKNFKSEEAFKLVSEAYACLADRTRRKTFTVERSRTLCTRCYTSSSINEQQQQQQEQQSEPMEELKSEEEMLREFRKQARARVNKLTEDIRTRRSRWSTELETAREKFENKRDRKAPAWESFVERPIRESDVFQPSTNQPGRRYRVSPDTDLVGFLIRRRNLQREKFVASQSLDGFLTKLKSESASISKKDLQKQASSSERDRLQGRRTVEATTNTFFTKRVSPASETLPARKLFKEDVPVEQTSDEAGSRAQNYPIFERSAVRQGETSRSSSATRGGVFVDENCEPDLVETAGTQPSGEQTPPAQRRLWHEGNVVGFEESSSNSAARRENPETVWTGGFCCSKTSMLKEQRQKSEELLKTLERLREEAKDVAETLDKLKRSSDL